MNMNMNRGYLDKIAVPIRAAMEDGALLLQDPKARSVVHYAIVRAFGEENLRRVESLDEWALMKELTAQILSVWPDQYRLHTLGFIAEALPSLNAIMNTLNPDFLNKDVAIFPDPCRMVDPRMPLSDFKTTLWKVVLETRA